MPSTFWLCIFDVEMVWYVQWTLSFHNCTWKKPLNIKNMRTSIPRLDVKYKTTEGLNGVGKRVSLINCNLSDASLLFSFSRGFNYGNWKVDLIGCHLQGHVDVVVSGSVRIKFERCLVRNAFHVDVADKGSVIIKFERCLVRNAVLEMVVAADMYDRVLVEILLSTITLVDTTLDMHQVSKLNITNSRFENLSATIDGGGKYSEFRIYGSTFGNPNPNKPQDPRLQRCIANQKSFLNLRNVKLEVVNSTFSMSCILQKGFIEWSQPYNKEHNKLAMKDTVLDAERILITLPLISTPFGADAIDMDNVTLRCKTQAKHQQIGFDWELQCVASCDGGRYRSHIKSTEISLKKNERGQLKGKSLVSPCVPCPVGINCNDEVPSPLPNYWGYTDKEGKIRMMRCPEDYCCKGGHCQNSTSCAEGRTGTLCGQCETNTTESLFSAACISANQCQTLFVAVCYVLAALLYALFLLLFNPMKKVVLHKLKKTWKRLKMKVRQRERKDEFELQNKEETFYRLIKEPKQTEKKEETDSGMKYLQILLYFVQDAALFQVYLPDSSPDADEKTILVQFLEFSPRLLLFYVKVTNLCLISTTTAVLKVALKALFGPCIMVLLFLILIGQILVSHFIRIDTDLLDAIRAKLCEAFTLTILFSYQTIVQGAFTLVQCVDINDTRRLFIQADIVCFTWWQTAIEIFLSLAAVPVFIFLATAPYFIKNKQISVPMFLAGCIFPLPCLVYLIVVKMRQNTRCIGSSFSNPDHTSSDIGIPNSKLRQKVVYTATEESLMETLLKHYKTLRVCGVCMTWLVFLKLYRMALVWCSTYITEPLPRLCGMTVLVLLTTVLTVKIKPYKENIANNIAFFSYIASLCIVIINITKSALISGVYKPTSLVQSVLTYLNLCDTILLSWLPIGAIATWILYSMWNLIKKK